MSIVKSIIFEKPNSLKLLVSFMLFVGLFAVMSLIPFLPDIFRIIGLIMSGIIIGFSFALTRNIIVPLLIIVGYNSIVSALQISVIPYSSIDMTDIVIWFGEGLFVVFVILWCAFVSRKIHEKFNESIKELSIIEGLTFHKMLIGSVVAGVLFGIFMVIRVV